MKKGNKRRIRIAVWMLACVLLAGAGVSNLQAASYTVKACKAIMYTNEKATVYSAPDFQSVLVTTIGPNLPIDVTGITSNGWFQVELKGIYYIPGYGLQDKADESGIKPYQTSEIEKLTKGTFSFYKNAKLRSFTEKDIEEMDANQYIKYMDSYLMGNGMVENCILADSLLTVAEAYKGASAADPKVAAVTHRDYLMSYRMKYLESSILGPIRTQEELKLAMNRAIRYGYEEFTTVYKNAIVGTKSDKMESVLKEVLEEMEREQGVSFAYEKKYASLEESKDESISGWILKFTMEEADTEEEEEKKE